jgi:hypothetical protein
MEMEGEVLKYFLTQGVFAALFVWLLMDTRKDNKEREKGYQDTIKDNQQIINKLTDKFNVVESIKEDVEDIKEIILK